MILLHDGYIIGFLSFLLNLMILLTKNTEEWQEKHGKKDYDG